MAIISNVSAPPRCRRSIVIAATLVATCALSLLTTFFGTTNLQQYVDVFSRDQYALVPSFPRTGRDVPKNTYLPLWVHEYLDFHSQTRSRFDFPHASDIKFLFVICKKTRIEKRRGCGGISDRLRSFDYYLHIANSTGRILLYYWEVPRAVEDFLTPPENGLDWRLPAELKTNWRFHVALSASSWGKDGGHGFKWDTEFRFVAVKGTQAPKASFMNKIWIENDDKISSFPQEYYAGTLAKVREERSSKTISTSPILRELFDLMFQPVTSLALKIQTSMSNLGLVPRQYGAAHIRASYPTQLSKSRNFQGKNGTDFDKIGYLHLEGATKREILKIGRNAVKRAGDLALRYFEVENKTDVLLASPHKKLSIYVASDSIDTISLLLNGSNHSNTMYLVSLPPTQDENLHFDGPKSIGRPTEDFDSIFIDFWLMKNAACVSYGVGGYGYFAALLSGTQCTVDHQDPTGNVHTGQYKAIGVHRSISKV